MYRALFDTCVLVPGLQRHFLLQLATEEAFAPLWSSGTVWELDDPGDGHVAHAAILGKADAIVTNDRRSGLAASVVLREAAIEVLHPSGFAANTVAAHPEAGVRALRAMAGRMSQPAQTPQEILLKLRDRYGMMDVAEMLQPGL